MKERPILFSGPMVRAILAGKKTQTRRIVKTDLRPQTEDTFMRGFPPNPENVRFSGMYAKCDAPPGSRSVSYRVPCPYGWLGERLWVRETFFSTDGMQDVPRFAAMAQTIIYRADYEYREPSRSVIGDHKWKPSIFMRRGESRLTLEITMIGVERLHDISESDAEAEGVERNEGNAPWTPEDGWLKYPLAQHEEDFPAFTARESYESLWSSINGTGSWEANPWVWVIDFKRI